VFDWPDRADVAVTVDNAPIEVPASGSWEHNFPAGPTVSLPTAGIQNSRPCRSGRRATAECFGRLEAESRAGAKLAVGAAERGSFENRWPRSIDLASTIQWKCALSRGGTRFNHSAWVRSESLRRRLSRPMEGVGCNRGGPPPARRLFSLARRQAQLMPN